MEMRIKIEENPREVNASLSVIGGGHVATVWSGVRAGAKHTPTMEAVRKNAALFAAAPKLLAALQLMVANYEECYGDEGKDAPESVKQAKAAIAAATAAQ